MTPMLGLADIKEGPLTPFLVRTGRFGYLNSKAVPEPERIRVPELAIPEPERHGFGHPGTHTTEPVGSRWAPEYVTPGFAEELY